MIVFIDNDYKCHINNDGTMREVKVPFLDGKPFFDGKCKEYIEGFRFVPEGEVWTRDDGEVFRGKMITPWRDYNTLLEYQTIYERMLEQQADMQAEGEQLKAQNTEYEAALTEIENALEVSAR